MTRSFAVTFDYRCPFARNAHEALVTALREGRDWDVRFAPFSLDQIHVPEGEPPVWDRAPEERGTGTLALQWGIAVRDHFPDKFFDLHIEMFAARHDHALKLGHEDVVRGVAEKVGLDVEAVGAEVESGRPLKTLAEEHTEAVQQWAVFGVPTFIEGDSAAFIRFMERNHVADLDRALELLPWMRLNEYKQTKIPR
jgi:predicted DsbA family dithiol-disulfide isomerase